MIKPVLKISYHSDLTTHDSDSLSLKHIYIYITGSAQGIQCTEIQDELACRMTVSDNTQVRTLH